MLFEEPNPVPLATPRCAAHSWAFAKSCGLSCPFIWFPEIRLAAPAKAS
jgi:hypothetical protein